MASADTFSLVPNPTSVLFSCTHNAIRSPMAEAALKHYLGTRIYVDSVGLHAGDLDPFAVQVMSDAGFDLSHHRPKTFKDLQDDSFDLVISLSPEAHHWAIELTRTTACEVEYWPTADPSIETGNRDQRLQAYCQLRDQLLMRIKRRFDIEEDLGT